MRARPRPPGRQSTVAMHEFSRDQFIGEISGRPRGESRLRSRCGIKSGIESVSLIVELVSDVKLSYSGLAEQRATRTLQRRRKWWR